MTPCSSEIVWVDHFSIGTDQHVTPGSVPDYTQWVHLVTAMLRGGFTSEEAEKIAGGNLFADLSRRGRLWLPAIMACVNVRRMEEDHRYRSNSRPA